MDFVGTILVSEVPEDEFCDVSIDTQMSLGTQWEGDENEIQRRRYKEDRVSIIDERTRSMNRSNYMDYWLGKGMMILSVEDGYCLMAGDFNEYINPAWYWNDGMITRLAADT